MTHTREHHNSRMTDVSYAKEDIDALFEAREASLRALERTISPKLYQNIHERILAEKKAFTALFLKTEEKKEELSHYSFVLHPYFFEQHFLGNDA